MTDDVLEDVWATLEPSDARRRRMNARVSAWLDARDTSLAAEWLALFKVAPLPALGLATVSAVSLLLAPPFVWFARSLL